jgi:plastocyanin
MARLLGIALAALAFVSAAMFGVAQENGVQVLVGTPVTWSVDGTPVQSRDVVAITGMDEDSYAFTPTDITVPVGTEVTWDNVSNDEHTVTPSDEEPLGSGTIQEDRSYSYVFNTAGIFEYFCEFHDMSGKVTVE